MGESNKSMVELLCKQTIKNQLKIMSNLSIKCPNRKRGLALAYSTEIVKELMINKSYSTF